MKSRVQKWGNSLAVRIPKALAEETELDENREVTFSVRDGDLIVTPVRRRRRPTLDELVDAITPENRHPETDWGPPVGKEVW